MPSSKCVLKHVEQEKCPEMAINKISPAKKDLFFSRLSLFSGVCCDFAMT